MQEARNRLTKMFFWDLVWVVLCIALACVAAFVGFHEDGRVLRSGWDNWRFRSVLFVSAARVRPREGVFALFGGVGHTPA